MKDFLNLAVISFLETKFQKVKYYICLMVVISKAIIRNFVEKHADAETPLNNWYALTSNADWKNFNEMRSSFNSVDAVGNDRYVFNIKGNSYRLIALVIFKVRTVFILFIGTHSEYDNVDAKTIIFKG